MAELRRVGWIRASKRVIKFDVGSLSSLHLLKPFFAILQTITSYTKQPIVGEEFS